MKKKLYELEKDIKDVEKIFKKLSRDLIDIQCDLLIIREKN